jgi:D-glycero-alpha-D-manno-heptose-7-phosphate kinase
MGEERAPVRAVHAAAPIRICDNGGWTDTWFAGHGCVFNIAVEPRVEVQVALHPIASVRDRIVVHAANFGDNYGYDIGAAPGRHPLLEATVEETGVPADVAVEITVASDVPAGASTGTSAAVVVALIGALDALTPGRMSRAEVAAAAHRVETDRLGVQSGIQDQLCAAYGGINFIEMPAYPHATVTQLAVADNVVRDLEQRLVLVFLGRAHESSAVHDEVIARLEREGGGAPQLDRLRRAAVRARDAVLAGDLAELGQAMIANNEAQRALHSALIGDDAQAAIDVAAARDAWGWKVNGAGGDGGSITVLHGGDAASTQHLIDALRASNPAFRAIPVRIDRVGLRVWDE